MRSRYALEARCVRCGSVAPLGEAYLYACGACGGILDIGYDYQAIAADHDLAGRTGPCLARYRPLLPLREGAAIVSLGEGDTALLACTALGTRLGVARLYAKNEAANPTGSFKDRPLAVAITKAVELGIDTVCTASSGNAGAATAAYAARAGLRAVVFLPATTPRAKTLQALAYGARVIAVRGSYADAYAMARRASEACGWANVTTTYLSPYPTEGDKTIAYEICEQLAYRVPDKVIVPVGAGPLLAGMLKGFREFRTLGLTTGTPSMVAVQAEGCAPIARAYAAGSERVQPWERPATVASGIGDPLHGYTQDGEYTLCLVRESGGEVVAVSDDEILQAMRLLASSEGLYAEPSAAAAVAGLARLAEAGRVGAGDTVVCIITGHGLKDMDAAQAIAAEDILSCDSREDDLADLLARLG